MEHRLPEGVIHVLGLDIVELEEFVGRWLVIRLDGLPELFVHSVDVGVTESGAILVLDVIVFAALGSCRKVRLDLEVFGFGFDGRILYDLVIV